VGTTNIYNWPIPDYPDSADGPSSLGALGRAVEDTVNIQNTRRVYYTATASPGVPVGSSSLGGWPNAGGFVGNSSGITVPEAGIYIVSLAATNLSATVTNPRTAVRITIGGGIRGYFPVGSVIAYASYMNALAAGGQVNLFFENNEPALLGTALILNIAKVAA